jgi:tetratricopeptide (TPR) repeat protein
MTALHRALLIILALLHAAIAFTAHAGELDDIQRLADKGHHQDVLENVQRYLLQHADDKRALFIQALALQHLERNKEAITSYELLTRRYPDSPEPWNNLAVLYAASGDHNKARDALLSALNTHPSYATAYENLGNIYAKMAVSAYNRALETGNNNEASAIALVNIDQLPKSKTAPVAVAQLAAAPAAVISDTKTGNDKEVRNIIDAVNGWSNAWAAQNVDGYLAYYAPGFKPAGGLSRSRWEKSRRELLLKPGFINITIKNPDVFIIDTRSARFSFEQSYTSDRFTDLTRKTLVLEKIDGQWQILREYAEG